ncbi:MAG: hypothetical protein JXA42_23940, partial [Anaerolineales bacterium]|nr:hypothetical protein [Anaerolineales bacterium]
MAKETATHKSQKQETKPARPLITAEPASEFTPSADLLVGHESPSMQTGADTVERHADVIGHVAGPGRGSSQLIGQSMHHLQRTYGNRYMQQVMSRLGAEEKKEDSPTPEIQATFLHDDEFEPAGLINSGSLIPKAQAGLTNENLGSKSSLSGLGALLPGQVGPNNGLPISGPVAQPQTGSGGLFGRIGQSVHGAMGTIGGLIGQPRNAIGGFLGGLGSRIGSGVSSLTNRLGGLIGQPGRATGGFLGGLGSRIGSGAGSLTNSLGGLIGQTRRATGGFLGGLGSRIG